MGSGLVGFLPKRSFSDQELEAAIKQRITMDGRIDVRGIQIKVNQGNVTIEGTVPSLADKALVDGLVATTMGVRSVRNLLTVKQAGTKDVELKRAVEDVLRTVPVLYGADIYVTAKDGIVTLKGDVEKPRHSRAAEKAAEQVQGVIEVVNLL